MCEKYIELQAGHAFATPYPNHAAVAGSDNALVALSLRS